MLLTVTYAYNVQPTVSGGCGSWNRVIHQFAVMFSPKTSTFQTHKPYSCFQTSRVLRSPNQNLFFTFYYYMNNIFSMLKPQHFHHLTCQFYNNFFFLLFLGAPKKLPPLEDYKHVYVHVALVQSTLPNSNLNAEIDIKINLLKNEKSAYPR